MDAMIKPTVGRVVWFYPSIDRQYACAKGEPLAAIITAVHSDTCVNLVVFTSYGETIGESSVMLLQGDEDRPEAGFAEWMPYQKGQAAKTESLEKEIESKDYPQVRS